jgi:cobalamin biosynthesis Mg chelatase CobN
LTTDQQQWLDDMRGMSAGLLSVSITMPELDGVIGPLLISTMEPNEGASPWPPRVGDLHRTRLGGKGTAGEGF